MCRCQCLFIYCDCSSCQLIGQWRWAAGIVVQRVASLINAQVVASIVARSNCDRHSSLIDALVLIIWDIALVYWDFHLLLMVCSILFTHLHQSHVTITASWCTVNILVKGVDVPNETSGLTDDRPLKLAYPKITCVDYTSILFSREWQANESIWWIKPDQRPKSQLHWWQQMPMLSHLTRFEQFSLFLRSSESIWIVLNQWQLQCEDIWQSLTNQWFEITQVNNFNFFLFITL